MRGNGLSEVRPPALSVGPLGWLRRNLFSSPFNTVLTLFGLYVLYRLVPPFLDWAFVEATWRGTSREACSADGACWVFVGTHVNQFLYGLYPAGQQWRVNVVMGVFAGVLVLLGSGFGRRRPLVAFGILAAYPVPAAVFLMGGRLGLVPVETAQWGGLMLTLTIAVVGIATSLPLGIFLALGRRSSLPLVRWFSVAFIEFWRGVPLITVLFMASVMLPLFLPEGLSFDKLLRAVIGIVLFQSAYMAEVVRGGLQAIPGGQYEAAKALGLGYWQGMGLVVLPQALRHVIPGIVNTLIALFKDTALVLVIGMFDLLGIVQAAFSDPNWIGFAVEGYVFAGLVFWVFCFGMSRFSQRLEHRLSRGQ